MSDAARALPPRASQRKIFPARRAGGRCYLRQPALASRCPKIIQNISPTNTITHHITHHRKTKTISTTHKNMLVLLSRRSFFPKQPSPRVLFQLHDSRYVSSFLNIPTPQDAQELFLRMDSRPGSLITTYNDNDDDDDHRLIKYNQDWTVSILYDYIQMHALPTFAEKGKKVFHGF